LKITKEIKTALLVLSTILLFIWGYSMLKGKDLLTDYRTFYVQYDNVEGLSPSASVTINGLIVGKISKITLNQSTGKLLVELQLKTDFPISKSSTAVIYKPGFIEGKQIAIYPNLMDKSKSESGQILRGSSDLDVSEALKKQLIPVQAKFEKVMLNADQLLTGFNLILDKNGQQNLKSSLAELSQTMEQFHKTSSTINTVLDENKGQIKSVVANLSRVSTNFSTLSDSLTKVNVVQTVSSLKITIEKIDKLMISLEAGQGTAGKLLTDETLYKNLEKTSKELELLLEDVRLNPTRYVNISLFGKKNKPYVAPLNDSLTKAKNL
jgi:phospholipid/cholesterol/gamma-HCH transport system substrate-binding protein